MALTDAVLRKSKPAAKPVKLADSGGLYLLLNPNGSKWWRWDYRRPVTAKLNTLSLDTYPDVGLAQVRQRCDDARKLLANGIDPGQHRKAEKAAGEQRAGNSFEVVAREWLAKQTWAPNYLSKVTVLFENDVFPSLGSRPVPELTAPEFLKVARRIEARGAIETTHRAMQNCGQVVRYAIATGRADRNPVADLKGALAQPEEKHFAAIVDVKLVGGLLRAIDGYVKAIEDEVAVHLITIEDDFKAEQQAENLQKITDACSGVDIRFTWGYDPTGTIHARHIMTDHGWKILLDRGLDVFQRFEMSNAFDLSNRMQQHRQCKAFEVTFLRSEKHGVDTPLGR